MSLSPSKIVCVGRNYSAHARELGNDIPAEPLLFLKPPSSEIGSGDAIELPPESTHVEYEGEIGIVIGRRLRLVQPSEAASAIRAIVAVNDVTARDLQRSDSQWARAKGFDTFCPIGAPGAVPNDLETLEVITRVNGEQRQHGSAREMVFAIPVLLAYIAQVMTLEPGDLVLTGTPAGTSPLHPGDEVEVEIPGVSRVRNTVRART